MGALNQLYKLKLSDTPNCSCDNQSIDDINHRLFYCGLDAQAVSSLLTNLNKYHILPLNSPSLLRLATVNQHIENLFVSYLKMSKMRI